MMPFEIFKKGVDSYIAMGGEWIEFTPLAGDPLADVNLFDKISYAKSAGIKKVSFATNAILLDSRENYRRIIDSGVDWLQISTPGFDRSAYERIYRTSKYDDVINGIINLAEYKKSTGSDILIVTAFRIDRPIEQVYAEEGFLKLKKYYDQGLLTIDRENIISEMHNWTGQVSGEDLPQGMILRPALEKRFNIPCVQILGAAAVMQTGQVRMCACRYLESEFDDLIAGDINEADLGDILNGPGVSKLIKRMLSGDWPAACHDCTLYKPASVFTLYRNLFLPGRSRRKTTVGFGIKS